MCILLQKAGVSNTCLLLLLSAPKTVHVPMYATSSKPPLLLAAYRYAVSLTRSGDFSSPHKICDFAGAPKRTNSSLNFTKFQQYQCMRREHGCISIACTKAFAPYSIRRLSRHHNYSLFIIHYSLKKGWRKPSFKMLKGG